ncbi:Wdr34 [Scenedesmus sp. PABB004]|nr:Wdr34 [Scenedesmus sp. PABB004]
MLAATVSRAPLSDAAPELAPDVAPVHAPAPPAASVGVGTEPLPTAHAATQAVQRADAGTQASGGPGAGGAAAPAATADAAGLAAALRRAAPRMLAGLAAMLEPRGAAPRRAGAQLGEAAQPQLLLTLSAFGGARPNKHGLQVTSLAWSKTGQTLAAAFGRYDAAGWCCVPGAVATWSLGRAGAAPGAPPPERLLPVGSGATALAFHPDQPALLAGGTFNGEVVLWDLRAADDADTQAASTDALGAARHRAPVVDLAWQFSGHEARRHGARSAAHRLFSLGADGRLLVWLAGPLANPIAGYELRWAPPERELPVTLGGSCMAFCPAGSAHEEAAALLVGDISDASLREFAAKLEAAAAAPGAGGARLELRGAVKDGSLQPLAATVNGLCACPQHRQLALAAGGDGSLRVLDMLRAAPLLSLEPSGAGLLACGWSPSRPLVFAAASADGAVYVYDLAARQRLLAPVAALQVGGGGAGGAGAGRQQGGGVRGANALAFNAAAPGTLAAAAGDEVSVWRLPPALAEGRPGEAKLLARLLESEDARGLLRAQGLVPAA